MSDVHNDDIKNLLDKHNIQHTEVVMYRTVSNDFGKVASGIQATSMCLSL